MKSTLIVGQFLAALLALSGCDMLTDSPRPELREPVARDIVVEPSARSLELAQYYAGVQRGLLTEGLLRTDGGGPDTPFNARQLAENFSRIALYDELTFVNGRYRQQESASGVRRWTTPVRVAVEFGDAVPLEIRSRDQSNLRSYVNRLRRVSGAPIDFARAGEDPNFHVVVLTVDEIEGFEPRLREILPNISPSLTAQITNMPRITYCAVYTFSRAETPNIYDTAVAVIRAEHPNLMRDSCYHEEVAQGLGLANDSPRARPSIFNDDSEFAFLTTHDELLLRMLYDTRLTPGMTEASARPIINDLAREYLGGES